MEKDKPNVLILNVEGLRAEFLGPYGNDWIDTPHFNRLAVEGFVFDHCLAGGIKPRKRLTALWTGCHPTQSSLAESPSSVGIDNCLPHLFRQAGWSTILVSASDAVIQHPGSIAFDEHRLVAPVKVADDEGWQDPNELVDDPAQLVPVGQPAQDWSETRTAAIFSELIELIERSERQCFIWCQLTTLNSVWEAPLDIRERFREPGDPPIWPGINIPRARFGKDVDPDVYLPFVQAYAAEVHILDLCLGGLLEVIGRLRSQSPWVVVLVSSSGLPLGEHGYLGVLNAPYHAELLHVPLFFVLPDGRGQAERSQALVYPHDTLPTVIDYLGLEDTRRESPAESTDYVNTEHRVWIAGRSVLPIIRGDTETVRDRLLIYDGSNLLAIRTPAWFAQVRLPEVAEDSGESEGEEAKKQLQVLDSSDVTADRSGHDRGGHLARPDEQESVLSYIEIAELRKHIRLFVKPDDRWEINEIADRCPEVAVQFLRMARGFVDVYRSQTNDRRMINFLALPPLTQELAKGIDS